VYPCARGAGIARLVPLKLKAVNYFNIVRLEPQGFTKAGIPGFPHLEPSQVVLLEALEAVQGGNITDLSARGGAVALDLVSRGAKVVVSDPSAAALSCLRQTGLPLGIFDNADAVLAILNGERGNARVAHTISEAWRCTKLGGVAYLAGDKDKGFERYFKEAKKLFGGGEIVARAKGFRAARLEKTNPQIPPPLEPLSFVVQARGQDLKCVAYAGTFASGKLDAASQLLLLHLPNGNGRMVLDIGAGYGVLAGFLALEGANVTLLEDDALSVESAKATLLENGLSGRVLHSDVDDALEPDAKFDLLVMNPPFHVGRDLRLDVAEEFIRAANRHASKNAEVWLVANHFLPYEKPLSQLGQVQVVAREHGFKVFKVSR
jgi:16S rRNA (guanine1207-N2)-methyltransferase